MAATVKANVQKFLDNIDKKLHENNGLNHTLGEFEAKTGVKRLHVVIGFAVLHALYLIFGHFAELLCNIIGFLYPAIISIAAIESHTKEDDTQWLTYWVIFAFLNIIEFFSESFTKYFPIYWLCKCCFLLYLYLPMTTGAQKIYHRVVKPLVNKHQPFFEKNFGRVAEKMDRIGGQINEAARREFEQHVKPN